MLCINKSLRHSAEMKYFTTVEHCLILCFPHSSHFGKCCVHVPISIGKDKFSDEAVDRTVRNRALSSVIRGDIAQERQHFHALKL